MKKNIIYLQDYQKEAFNQFKETGYVLVDAYRRAGKTELLKAIFLYHKIEDIGMFTLSYAMFRHEYGDMFKSIRQRDKAWMNFNAPVFLCDEFIISPIEGKRIACVTTGFTNVTKWKVGDNKFIDNKETKRMKKAMTKDAYKACFGNYV